MGSMSFINNETPLESREGQLTFVALIMMLYVMAVFIAIAVHEVLGHGLATILLGGDFYALYLSPGSGFISFYLPDTISTNQVAFIYMAGILVQIMLGLIVLFLVFPRIKSFVWGLFALLFSAALLVHSSLYLFLGYFYQSGDTRYAVLLLQVRPDIFLVAGLIMAGVFIILISIYALNFIGSFIDVGEDSVKNRVLIIFWLPPILLSGVSAVIAAFYVPANEVAYTLVNAILILFFMGIAIYLVPMFVEPPKIRNSRLSFKSVFSVMIIFLLLISSWIGVFGLNQETAHGVMLHEPPVETEQYYRTATVGNMEIYMYHNQTAKIDIILRNQLDNASPLEEEIFHTFDNRPNWNYYIQRSRSMLITMFDLPRDVGDNLTFSTDYGTARALGVEDDLGRVCTTYVEIGEIFETRSIYHEGIGWGMSVHFIDPWSNINPRGFLDEVRVSWGNDLRLDAGYGEDAYQETIPYNRGSQFNNSIGWKNINVEESPVKYTLIFTNPIIAPENY